MTEFNVKEGNVLHEPSDLLLLKYAQSSYGADQVVAEQLMANRICEEADMRPRPGEFVVIQTKGSLAARRVMFLGTPPLRNFNYDEMEVFAGRAIENIAHLGLPIRLLTTTVHGTGYGLDGGEALQRLVRGFKIGLSDHPSAELKKITFLTLGERSQRMLTLALQAVATATIARSTAVSTGSGPRPTVAAGRIDRASGMVTLSAAPEFAKLSKGRVFVAMPFSEEFQNVYEFGIYPAIRNCGLICERVDETHFTGDVLHRIRGGIEAADLVVADLTEGRPNVYLEVGYAWGRGVPVIFVAKKGEKLHFDVSTHRCIYYGKFTQFARELEELIRGIDSRKSV